MFTGFLLVFRDFSVMFFTGGKNLFTGKA